MLLLLKFMAKGLALLNSEVSPKQIAAGFTYGLIIGLVPIGSLFPLVLLLVGLIINFNLAAMFLAAAIFKVIAFFTDSMANGLGYYFLTQIPALKSFWTTLYNTPLLPYTQFNNTIVLGSFLLGLLAATPVFFLVTQGVAQYRARWRERIQKWKVVQVIKASAFFKYYAAYREWRG